MAHNERGAGRKPLPYKTVQKRIPEPLVDKIEQLIAEYKKSLTQGETA